MTFADKLRSLRKKAGMSQEILAEKLNVSRQAVTKWETSVGVPDIENITAISALFDISVDELLCNRKAQKEHDFPFESVTEYDIDQAKSYDMNLGGAARISLRGCDGEKLRVRLASDKLSTVANDFKVKIDDNRKRLDVEVVRKNGATEAAAKGSLVVFVDLPQRYVKKVEVKINAGSVDISALECENIELDVKTEKLSLDGVAGTVEINCNLDMDITCHTLNGAVEVNQLSATSRINVPHDAKFDVRLRGVGTNIFYERNGERVEPFNCPDADNIIELNGIKSELAICSD